MYIGSVDICFVCMYVLYMSSARLSIRPVYVYVCMYVCMACLRVSNGSDDEAEPAA